MKPNNLSIRLSIPTEYQECRCFWDWCILNPKIRNNIIHIPNEGKRTKIGGFLLKKIGLKAGTSDYFLTIPTKDFHGLWIEMKRKNSKSSLIRESQIRFIDDQIKMGYQAKIAYGADHAIKIVREYLQLCA